ncbi:MULTISPECIES: ribose-5-phosphate isomerase RpiA [Hydrotalea]|uniref:ribose-5-phosphate isomerase RpiA n=1 Tax=Hydrotalea TaxID=1004300 RepID=UPI001E498155|nr:MULTISPECIES: ribose-5-phosphate isomerase RpiA [Hydrotalea]
MDTIQLKQKAAEKAITYVKSGMTVGLGTGSTAYWAIQFLGEKVKQGLAIQCIATSQQSDELARSLGIPMTNFAEISKIDITIDGADETTRDRQLIKGGGAALLREKIVAAATEFYIIIVDEHKVVDKLGKFKVPIEVVPFGYEFTIRKIQALGAIATLRLTKKNNILITDNHNYIVDADFGLIEDASSLHNRINDIVGVVENGLFINMASIVVVAHSDGNIAFL